MAAPLQRTHKVLTGDRYISQAKAALGEAAFQQALAEGRAMSWTQATQYARELNPQ